MTSHTSPPVVGVGSFPAPSRFSACIPLAPCRYINFYMANNGAIVPQYGDTERDELALRVLQAEMPERKVVGVASRAILVGGGNIHCVTVQQPGVVATAASKAHNRAV